MVHSSWRPMAVHTAADAVVGAGDLVADVYDALRAGASGFMLKDAPPEELLAAVEVVARGDALIAPAVTRAVIEEFGRRSTPTCCPSCACAIACRR